MCPTRMNSVTPPMRPRSGISTSAALTACTTSDSKGLVIAEVRPLAMAMDRKELLMPDRLGSPKLILEAPQVELTPNSSRSRVRISNTCFPA